MNNINKRAVAIVAVAGLALAACGSDSDGGDGSSDQDKVADLVIGAAADAGAEPDSDCIRDAAQAISDDDAAALVEAGLEGDPDVSAATGEALAEMLTC
ncbi:MAG: hypothetical protein AB8G14_14335 [Ilumatobacter sp.]